MQAETSKWEEQKQRKKTLKQDTKEVKRQDKRKQRTVRNMDKREFVHRSLESSEI